MAYETSHILYEWETFVDVEIGGEIRRYCGGYHSQIIHRLANPQEYRIPDTALKTPVWLGYSADVTWYLTNGQELHLPHKLLI